MATDPWNDDPESSPQLEFYGGHLRQRPLWTAAEAGMLLLSSGKLEAVLHIADTTGASYELMAARVRGVDSAVRVAVAAGQIETRPDGDRVLLVPASFVVWALSQGYSLPAEIVALVEVGDWTERSEDTNAPTRTACATQNDYPLTPLESEILERLRSDGPLTAPQITELLYQDGSTNSQRSVEKVLAKLKSYKVVANRRGAGYFVVKDRGNT
ncbi:MAG: helix-turn-helix domain-containing protein [FCB group bacterium]|jgi:hypothetical protein|nr:helix-turn-helix domain-containing protein [FCB group bacterium]